jgi:hypothetical protein
MYRKAQEQEIAPEKFQLPFEEKLALDNRWVIMAKMIPWSEFDGEYAAIFSEKIGAHFDKLNDHQPKRLGWHWVH